MWHEKGGAEMTISLPPNWMNHRRAIMLNEILNAIMMAELLQCKKALLHQEG
jgi:hypothetical protein